MYLRDISESASGHYGSEVARQRRASVAVPGAQMGTPSLLNVGLRVRVPTPTDHLYQVRFCPYA
jgi:hypothetical protein